MLTITYKAIYSKFLSLVEAYDLTQVYNNSTTTEDANELLREWMNSVKSNPRVRRLFKTLILDNDNQQLTCEINASQGDDASDQDFVIDIFGIGMAYYWVHPKYLSVLNAAQMIGGKEEKFYSQANHMEQLANMSKAAKEEMNKVIKDYNTMYNSYLSAKS